MMATILTNEWTSVGEAYPPAGRVVLCIVERMLEGGRFSRRHDTAIWNGVECSTSARRHARNSLSARA